MNNTNVDFVSFIAIGSKIELNFYALLSNRQSMEMLTKSTNNQSGETFYLIFQLTNLILFPDNSCIAHIGWNQFENLIG